MGYGAGVLIERSMHPQWLSNAYLLADEPGGKAVFIDSGAPLDPLHELVEREGLEVTHLLTTHSHSDHVAGDNELVERYGLQIVKGPVEPAASASRRSRLPGMPMIILRSSRTTPSRSPQTSSSRTQ